MNVVDSSGWIEYLFERPNERFFAAVLNDTSNLLVPTVCLIEVIRYVTRAASRDIAQHAAAQMQRASVVNLDEELAHLAARLSLRHNLPLADAVVYATAQSHEATLYTQDDDFAKLPGVRYVRKK
jgi:predicted nucleic acid-binding protein